MSSEGVVRNMLVVFGVEVKNLMAAQRLEDGIASINEGMQRLNAMALKVAASSIAAGAGLVALTKPLADGAEHIDKFAKAFGMSNQRMQEMEFGFESLGAQGDDMSDVFLQISEKVRQATTGSKEAAKGFQDLGVSVGELKGLTPDQVFDRMIVGFRGVEDAQTKFALVSQLLGEDLGKKLLPIMTKGGVTLQQYSQIAKDAGVIMTDSQVETGKRVATTYRQLGAVIKALRMRIGLELMPYVDRIGQKMWKWYQANKALINQKIEKYAEKVGDSLEWVKETSKQIGRLIDRMGGLESIVKKLALTFAVLTGGKLLAILISMGSGVVTILGAITSAVTMSLLAVAALIGLAGGEMALVGEDFAVYARGGESFFGTLEKHFKKLPLSFQFMFTVLKGIKGLMTTLSSYFAWVGEEASVWVGILKPFLPWLVNILLIAGAMLITWLIAPVVLLAGLFTILGKVARAAFYAISHSIEWSTEKVYQFLTGLEGLYDAFIELKNDGGEWLTDILKPGKDMLMDIKDMLLSMIDSVADFIGMFTDIPGELSKALSPSSLGISLIEESGRFMDEMTPNFMKSDKTSRIADGPMVSRYKGGKGSTAGGAKSVSVTNGDTIIQVTGSGDPSSVADKVKRSQRGVQDMALAAAESSAGGM